MLVTGITNIVLISSHPSGNHSLAVTLTQGTNQYWSWGWNEHGQIGNGTNGETVVQAPPIELNFESYNPCGPCIQLGTNLNFTAPATGTLVLYFNDSDTEDLYNDNSGYYTVTISGFGQTAVPATARQGIPIGPVTSGFSYSCIATGFVSHANNVEGSKSDANGNMTNGVPWTCPQNPPFKCPDNQCYSLVGKILQKLE